MDDIATPMSEAPMLNSPGNDKAFQEWKDERESSYEETTWSFGGCGNHFRDYFWFRYLCLPRKG
ncbi:unnamed protein product [Timema podura]|uniref:Uncharacterized protein n=1 Tax=Timema podura TaxID=61482 RepID=A0ABN7P7Q3_TIMPD|nr:unnamed protein product [Timema podura]